MRCHAICKIVGLDAEIGQFAPFVCGRQVLFLVEGAYVLDVDGVETVWADAAEDGGYVGVLGARGKARENVSQERKEVVIVISRTE